MKTDKVGTIKFDKKALDVYFSLDEPMFRAKDVAELIDYSPNNVSSMVEMCEEDEKELLPYKIGDQSYSSTFITEMGLYNILAQSRKPIARKWRKIVHQELIDMRKARNNDILKQFKDWNHKLDDIYFDEETGIIMQSVTVAGGDVEQVPYKGELKLC